jgi:hypothetical protein
VSADQRVVIARDYLAAAASGTSTTCCRRGWRPSWLRLAAQLGQVLAAAVEMQRDADRLAQIRRVLAFRGLGGSGLPPVH